MDLDLLDVAVEYETIPDSLAAEAARVVLTRNPNAMVQAGPVTVGRDVTPNGKVGITFGQDVLSLEHHIGRTIGLVLETPTWRATALVIEEGHLWSRRRVTVLLDAVGTFGDRIQLTLSDEQVSASAIVLAD